MSELLKAWSKLYAEIQPLSAEITKIATQAYEEKFADQRQKEGFHFYTGFTVRDEETIIVHFKYGYGEFEYTDSFEHKIK